MDNPCKKETIVKIKKNKTSVYIPPFDRNARHGRRYAIKLQKGVMVLKAISDNYLGNCNKLAKVVSTGQNGYVGLRIPRNISERAGLHHQKKVFYLSQTDTIHVFSSYRQMLLYEVCEYYGCEVEYGDKVTLCGGKQQVFDSVEAALLYWLPELEAVNTRVGSDLIWAKCELDCIRAIPNETPAMPIAV